MGAAPLRVGRIQHFQEITTQKNSVDALAAKVYCAAAMNRITAKEAAEKLGVTAARIRHMLDDGMLTGEKKGRDWLITPESVVARQQLFEQPSKGVRTRVIQRDGGKCLGCGETELRRLHVHPKASRAADGGCEADFETLCCRCVEETHELAGLEVLEGGNLGVIRTLSARALRELTEPLVIQDAERALAVVVPYQAFMEQQAARS
jgi:excisionase family DNA binding protein